MTVKLLTKTEDLGIVFNSNKTLTQGRILQYRINNQDHPALNVPVCFEINSEVTPNNTVNQGSITANTLGIRDIQFYTGNAVSSTISSSGNSTTGVLTLDPAAAGATGRVVINGDLEVKGSTTTINSTEVNYFDPLLKINVNNAGTAVADASATQIGLQAYISGGSKKFIYSTADSAWSTDGGDFKTGTLNASTGSFGSLTAQTNLLTVATAGRLKLDNPTDVTSSSTVSTGGAMGIAGGLFVGKNLKIDGDLILTGSLDGFIGATATPVGTGALPPSTTAVTNGQSYNIKQTLKNHYGLIVPDGTAPTIVSIVGTFVIHVYTKTATTDASRVSAAAYGTFHVTASPGNDTSVTLVLEHELSSRSYNPSSTNTLSLGLDTGTGAVTIDHNVTGTDPRAVLNLLELSRV